MLTPAGASAMSVAIISAVKAGDHLLMVDSAYQPTRIFCDGVLKRFGVETEYYDPLVGAGIEALIRENTGAIFLESPGSLTFEVQDVPAITEVARARGVTTLMDNTWATPLYFPPARPRRRHLDAVGDEVHRRTFRRAAGHDQRVG